MPANIAMQRRPGQAGRASR